MGKAVIMISSEMQEILRVCDRILVMHEGEIAGELDADSAYRRTHAAWHKI